MVRPAHSAGSEHLASEHYLGHVPIDDASSRDQRAPPVVHFLLYDAAVGSMSRVWLYRAADDLPVAIEYCGLNAAGAEIENQPHNGASRDLTRAAAETKCHTILIPRSEP
jgi:hypothetical protein